MHPLQMQSTIASALAPAGLAPPQIRHFSHATAIRAAARPARRPRAPVTAPVVAAAAAPAAVLARPAARVPAAESRAIATIMECLSGVTGRGKGGMAPDQQAKFDAAVAALEAAGGVRAPAASPLLDGRWRLLYTSRPGTASPIQRTFTGVDAFKVYQEFSFPADQTTVPRVNNVVDFGPAVGYLKVEAEASTEVRPLPGFTPRAGKGLPFGLLGVSSTAPPAAPGIRVDFQFDSAAFYFKALPFSIPYPVPFRLLGDERKGFIDVTYMSGDGKFRLSRGNKGTLFVLARDDPPQQQLLDAIAAGADDGAMEVLAEAAAAAASDSGVAQPARSPAAAGAWRLVWTKQGATANPLQRRLAGSVRNWQIISADGGRLENRVELVPGLVRVRALAECAPEGPARTGVAINEVRLEVGPLAVGLPVARDARGFVDWLYLDEGMRVTRGSKGSLFVHVRDPSVAE